MRRLLILIAIPLLSSCATTKWSGKQEKQLIAAFGIPDSQFPQDNSKIYEYRSCGGFVSPLRIIRHPGTACKKRLFVVREGRVIEEMEPIYF